MENNTNTYLYEVTYKLGKYHQDYIQVRATDKDDASNKIKKFYKYCEIIAVSKYGN